MSARPSSALLGKVHVARKQLALDEGAYRAMLSRITGRTSAGDCNDTQLIAVIEELKAKGWKDRPLRRAPRRAGSRRLAEGDQVSKARALWLNLWHLGETDSPEEALLVAFAKRTTGVEALEWHGVEERDKLIRALRGWLARKGYSEPTAAEGVALNLLRAKRGLSPLDHGQACKVRLIEIQWSRIAARRAEGAEDGLDGWLLGYAGVPHHSELAPTQLDGTIEKLGHWLRYLAARAA
jgi:phage gp16-like protein